MLIPSPLTDLSPASPPHLEQRLELTQKVIGSCGREESLFHICQSFNTTQAHGGQERLPES